MAKRRTRKRATKRKKLVRRNPSPRQYARRAVSRARSTFAGLNFKSALKNAPYALVGMFGSKWFAKRFGAGASEGDPESWTWRSHLQGGLGAVATAFVANLLKPGSGQKVLEGGVNRVLYDIIQNELIAGNDWATDQFGLDGYDGDYGYLPGDVEEDETGRPYMLGQDNKWYELPEETTQGRLEPVGPLGTLQPVGPLGATDDVYRKALLDA